MRILLLLLVVLSPWPRHLLLDSTPSDTTQGVPPCTITASCRHSRLASAQGLSVPDESLGAGEVAAFDLFGLFEDLLELSDDFTGGKGTGSRPTRSRRGGSRSKAAFEDTQSLRQQQLELYYVAGMSHYLMVAVNMLSPVSDDLLHSLLLCAETICHKIDTSCCHLASGLCSINSSYN